MGNLGLGPEVHAVYECVSPDSGYMAIVMDRLDMDLETYLIWLNSNGTVEQKRSC
jgi:hypothetical protein